MQIEKNIAAMLQSKMKETGKTKLEFSEFEMSEFQIHGGGEQQWSPKNAEKPVA